MHIVYLFLNLLSLATCRPVELNLFAQGELDLIPDGIYLQLANGETLHPIHGKFQFDSACATEPFDIFAPPHVFINPEKWTLGLSENENGTFCVLSGLPAENCRFSIPVKGSKDAYLTPQEKFQIPYLGAVLESRWGQLGAGVMLFVILMPIIIPWLDPSFAQKMLDDKQKTE